MRVGNAALIDAECVGTVTIVSPCETVDVTSRLEDVAYVPELKFGFFSSVAAHQRKL